MFKDGQGLFPKGISERVKAAVIRRLQSAMASSASHPETEETPTGEVPAGEVATVEENPPQSATPAPTEEESKEDPVSEHGQIGWQAVEARDSDARDRSRSPKGTPASAAAGDEEIPVGDKQTMRKCFVSFQSLPHPWRYCVVLFVGSWSDVTCGKFEDHERA